MSRLFVLILVGFGLLSSCSREERPEAHFGPGPRGEDMEDARCK